MSSDNTTAKNIPESQSEKTKTSTGPESSGKKPARATFWERLPPWITTNLLSSRSRKTWLRCWLASWVCYVIILPNASLKVLGNAAFFALLASVMIPANVPVQLFVFVLATMVVGMCLGWGLGSAAMRGALAARNQLLLKASLEREAQSVAGLANPEALFQADIFAGKFLDTRSSVVFGVFLGVGSFIFALIRSYAPKLLLMSVFGTIALDIFCSYGPLFPFAEYTILNSLLTSVACYIAIGIVLVLLVFPETINHAALVSASALVGKLKDMVDVQQNVMESTPEDLAPDAPLALALKGSRVAVLGHIQQLMASTKFIGLEFSWGKWNAEDVKGLEEPLMATVTRTAALHSFAKLSGHRNMRDGDQSTAPSNAPSEVSDDTVVAGDTYLLSQLRARHQLAEATYSVRLADVMPTIKDATADLREACSKGLGSVRTVLDGTNTKRYARKGAAESEQQLKDLDQAFEVLQQTVADFKATRRLELLQPFQAVIASADVKRGAIPLRTLYVSYVFAANLVVLAEGILDLMAYVQTTAAKRSRNRLWAPGGLRAIAKALTSRGDVNEQTAGEDNEPPVEKELQQTNHVYKRDPDSRPPTNSLQSFANNVHHLYKWTKTPEALFCFRYALVTIALWIPAVCRTSAHFIYVEKGLWALIMAQTTMNLYASDQIFNYVTRILGTFCGALLGLLTWYIGSAKSNGSPYGAAAVVAVMLGPVSFIRLFIPPQYLAGTMLFAATWVLVVGYSWLDGNLPIVGNPGIGWPIAWKRFVTVMIGSAASFIVMMLPPKSGRKAVRLRNASIIMSLSTLYSDIVAAWISSESRPREKPAAVTSLKEWIPGVREKIIAVAGQLQAVKTQTAIAKWEGSIRGHWPSDEYLRLADVEIDMMSNLALLGGALAQVDNDMRIRFLQHTRVLNPNFIADVMGTFSLVAQALRTGEPMPQAFHQNLLDRLHYHGNVGRRTFVDEGAGSEEEGDACEATHRDHLEYVAQYEYMFYACAIASMFQLIDGLNELRAITTNLCGEIPLEGFSRWKDEYDRAHVVV